MTIRKENTMKTKFRRILAAVMATATMATGVGSLTANAESLPAEETMEIILIDEATATPYASVPMSYDCSSEVYLGKFKANSSTVRLSFGASTDGQAAIHFRTGSSTGTIHETIIPPAEGTTGSTLSTSFSVTAGTTYYITVEPTGGYIHTEGSFTITY
ncbi:MAG: hypothetical protein IJY85_01120 [Ruminococcus sp.]|nr:hypothetical protein [Ruminococcus sp.]